MSHLYLAQYPQAVTSFQNALALKPDLHQCYPSLALAFQFQEHYDQAILYYRKFLSLFPKGDVKIFNNLGMAYSKTK